jgi:hypothetical protein
MENGTAQQRVSLLAWEAATVAKKEKERLPSCETK